MSRRPNAARRFGDGVNIPFVGTFHPKSSPSPLVSIGHFGVGALLVVGYLYHGSGGRNGGIAALSRLYEVEIRRSDALENDGIGTLRKVSRQEYLKKKEEKKLDELRDDIEDEQYLFEGVKLTEVEQRELRLLIRPRVQEKNT